MVGDDNAKVLMETPRKSVVASDDHYDEAFSNTVHRRRRLVAAAAAAAADVAVLPVDGGCWAFQQHPERT